MDPVVLSGRTLPLIVSFASLNFALFESGQYRKLMQRKDQFFLIVKLYDFSTFIALDRFYARLSSFSLFSQSSPHFSQSLEQSSSEGLSPRRNSFSSGEHSVIQYDKRESVSSDNGN